MIQVVWSPAFTRALRGKLKQNPLLRPRIETALHRLEADPFQPALHTHKLKGSLTGVWACTVDYDNRILFELLEDDAAGGLVIHLLALGTHDEVY